MREAHLVEINEVQLVEMQEIHFVEICSLGESSSAQREKTIGKKISEYPILMWIPVCIALNMLKNY